MHRKKRVGPHCQIKSSAQMFRHNLPFGREKTDQGQSQRCRSWFLLLLLVFCGDQPGNFQGPGQTAVHVGHIVALWIVHTCSTKGGMRLSFHLYCVIKLPGGQIRTYHISNGNCLSSREGGMDTEDTIYTHVFSVEKVIESRSKSSSTYCFNRYQLISNPAFFLPCLEP